MSDPPASATADPDIPAKIMLVVIFTCPIPPGIYPTISLQNLKIRSATDVRFITSAVRMNNGIATRAKLFSPVNILVPIIASPMPLFSAYRKEEMIIADAIGIPSIKNIIKLIKNSAILDIFYPPVPDSCKKLMGVRNNVAYNMKTHQAKADRQDCIHILQRDSHHAGYGKLTKKIHKRRDIHYKKDQHDHIHYLPYYKLKGFREKADKG